MPHRHQEQMALIPYLAVLPLLAAAAVATLKQDQMAVLAVAVVLRVTPVGMATRHP
jgi:hypothetical protein